MDSKYTLRMLEPFPQNFEFTSNPIDPIYRIMSGGAYVNEKLENDIKSKIDNMQIVTADPNLPYMAYYIQFDNTIDINRVVLTKESWSKTRICENEDDLMENNVTGFELVGEIIPSGLPDGAEILGLTYGFDWDNPAYYITLSGYNYVYTYTDGFGEIPTSGLYIVGEQSYDFAGFDEYINVMKEYVTLDDDTPDDVLMELQELQSSGIQDVQVIAKVAYLQREPLEGTLKIIDIFNLQNPKYENSNGIIVNSADYTVNGTKVIFANSRSDYNPATELIINDEVVGYNYPVNWQPDIGFNSTYIVEYLYETEIPRYLDMPVKMHDIPISGNPQASY